MTSTDSEPAVPLPGTVVDVDLTWIAEKIEHKIVFGEAIAERTLDPHHRRLSFLAQSVFAVLRWASSGDGHTVVRLEILRGGKPGTRVPFVRPAVDILLRVGGWPDVMPVLRIIDAMRAADIDPADAAPDYWLHVGNRLAAGERQRPYTRARHLVWQLRRRIAP